MHFGFKLAVLFLDDYLFTFWYGILPLTFVFAIHTFSLLFRISLLPFRICSRNFSGSASLVPVSVRALFWWKIRWHFCFIYTNLFSSVGSVPLACTHFLVIFSCANFLWQPGNLWRSVLQLFTLLFQLLHHYEIVSDYLLFE